MEQSLWRRRRLEDIKLDFDLSQSIGVSDREDKSKKMRQKIFFVIFAIFIFCAKSDAKSVRDFFGERDLILGMEEASYLGSDLILTPDETMANEYLMTHKVLNIT